MNDPFTAIQCIDQLADGLVRLSGRELPSRFRIDQDDELRVITTEPSWESIVKCTFGRIVPYVQTDRNVSAHLRQMIDRITAISQSGIE